MAPRTRRILLGLLLVLVLPVVAYFAAYGYDTWRTRGPDVGFESFTGVKLPPGVMVVEHTTRLTDNLLHRSHFWLLDGRREDFRDLATRSGLARSDADAKGMLAPALFDGKAPEMLEGYEGSLDSGRDRWLFVLYPGNSAVFQY